MSRGCNIFPIVKKKSAAIERHANRLHKFNSYRQLVFTEERKLNELAAEREIQAMGTADSGTAKKDLLAYKKFDARHGIAVLRPLLLYPKELIKEKEKLFG